MRALFLDIDGVVNSDRSVWTKIGPTDTAPEVILLKGQFGAELPYGVTYGLKTVDPVCVALVNSLMALDPNMYLVLSSTHRKYFSANEYHSAELRSRSGEYGSDRHLYLLRLYLEAMGFKVPLNFSITSKLYTERGVEVQHWLDENESLEIEHHAIIDDSTDFDRSQPVVYTDPKLGITFADFCKLTELLSLPTPSQILI